MERPSPRRPGDRKPESPGGSDDPGRNNPARDPGARPAGDPARAEGSGRWGDLPPRAREVFRSKGGTDMPSRYRDWIDAYYRRLNRIPGGS